MSNEINLVSNKNVDLEKSLKRLKAVRASALISLIVVLASAIVIFVLNILLPFESIKRDQQITVQHISLMHNKLVTFAMTKDRVRNISDIISQRKDYMSQLNALFAKVSSTLTVNNIEIKADTIDMSVSSKDLLSINTFIDDVVAFNNEGKIIKGLIIQGLFLDSASQNYNLRFEASIVNKKHGA